MEGSNGGQESRRNDSISSIMSLTTDNPSWTHNDSSDVSNSPAAPTTPRDNDKRAARARKARRYHARKAEHENREQPQRPTTPGSSNTFAAGKTRPCPETTKISDMDIEHSLLSLLEQVPSNEDLVYPFQRASKLPPITKESLAELEISRILNNPRLRLDVNFDKELHFRPNFYGYKGQCKIHAAEDYWKALLAEMELYRAIGERIKGSKVAKDINKLSRMMKASQKRMPAMFDTIKTILKTLIPARDHKTVEERLDTPMLMQQISNGAFNIMDLADWLSTLLKAHCAPMRDSYVNQMVRVTRNGVANESQRGIVVGLRMTLSALETMKLDVANHQIRHLRGGLIEDTINFQQRYYLSKLYRGRLEVRHARTWYKQEAIHLLAIDPTISPMEIFASALLKHLLSTDPDDSLPENFHLDKERTRALRDDICSYIQLNICCEFFDQLMLRRDIPQHVEEQGRNTFRTTLADIVGTPARFMEYTANIAAEMVRSVLRLENAEVLYDSLLDHFVENQLKVDLQPSSPTFRRCAQLLLDETLPLLVQSIESKSRLTTLVLHETMLPTSRMRAAFPIPQPATDFVDPDLKDILRRLTHLSVIHWQIWSPIVYTVQTEEDSRPTSLSENMTPASSSAIPGQNDAMAAVSASGSQAQVMGVLGHSSEPTEPSFLGGRPSQ